MSRSRSIAAAALAATAYLQPSVAGAVCDVAFDNAPAKGLRASMVRTFQPCPGSPYPPWGNTETEADTQACTPVFPKEVNGAETEYEYRREGTCEVKIAAKLAGDCASVEGSDGESLGLPPGPCHVSRIKVKCKDIQDGHGFLIGESDSGWTLSLTMRASIDDDVNGDMTVIDLPVLFEFEAPEGGSMTLDTVSAEALQDLGVVLPACTVLQISRMEIRDPLGLPFARMGAATVPPL